MSNPQSGPPPLTITVMSPEGELVQRVEFTPRDTISIGRSNECDLVLEDFGSKISRCHAVVLCDGGHWEYYSLGVNGSYDGGQKVETVRLVNGAAIRLSKRGPVLHFQIAGAPETASASSSGEITRWIADLKQGDASAAQRIWDRCYDRILAIAKRSLQHATSQTTDGEDIALAALQSLLTGLTSGRFPGLDRRDQLWRLLILITTCKAAAVLDRARRKKRSDEHLRSNVSLLTWEDDGSLIDGFERLEAHGSPEAAAAVWADETRELMQALPDELSRQIALLQIEGHTHEEIASRLECDMRTIVSRLESIRELWSRRLGQSDQD